jgi:glycerol-3-phosphate dehydrogenase
VIDARLTVPVLYLSGPNAGTEALRNSFTELAVASRILMGE